MSRLSKSEKVIGELRKSYEGRPEERDCVSESWKIYQLLESRKLPGKTTMYAGHFSTHRINEDEHTFVGYKETGKKEIFIDDGQQRISTDLTDLEVDKSDIEIISPGKMQYILGIVKNVNDSVHIQDINPIYHQDLREMNHYNTLRKHPISDKDRETVLKIGKFYHVSDKKNLDSILKGGFVPNLKDPVLGGTDLMHEQPSFINGTYVYVDFEGALETAKSSSGQLLDMDIEPVIFEIEMNSFEGRIYHDEDNLAWTEPGEEPSVFSVALAGDIRPENIKNYWVVDYSKKYNKAEGEVRHFDDNTYYKFKRSSAGTIRKAPAGVTIKTGPRGGTFYISPKSGNVVYTH